MGYGTPVHLAALTAHGATPLHRVSFAPVRAVCLPSSALAELDDDLLAASYG